MKKFFVIAFVCMLFAEETAAQDTVHYGDSCYLFNQLESPLRPMFNYYGSAGDTVAAIVENGGYGYNGGPEIYGVAKLYVASKDSVQVYGVAATMMPYPEDDTVTSWYTAYLFQYTGAQFVLIDSSAAWSQKNVFLYTAVGYGHTYNTYAPSYEFYFSQPHTVTDSFAISIKRKDPPAHGHDTGSYSLISGIVTSGWGGAYYEVNSFRNEIKWGRYFPIVQPERIGCEGAVAEVAERGGDYAVLEWTMEGDSCQLSVAPYDVAADSGLVVDLTANSYTATGLDTGVYYAARLRTQCRHHCHIHTDTVVWSDWGVPTLFYLGSEEPDTSGIGIRRVEEAVEFSVTPNPARGTATVRCAAGLQTVELLGVKGDVLLRREAAGSEACVLDLTGLAKGIYIVRITTPLGTAAQKLAVE